MLAHYKQGWCERNFLPTCYQWTHQLVFNQGRSNSPFRIYSYKLQKRHKSPLSISGTNLKNYTW